MQPIMARSWLVILLAIGTALAQDTAEAHRALESRKTVGATVLIP